MKSSDNNTADMPFSDWHYDDKIVDLKELK